MVKQKKYVSLSEIAKMWGMSRQLARHHLLKEDAPEVIFFGKFRFYLLSEVEQYEPIRRN